MWTFCPGKISAIKSKQLCFNCFRGSCHYSESLTVQMLSLSVTPSHYTSWSSRSSIINDFPSCISQYACCTCFRKHTAWRTNHHICLPIKLWQPQLWELGQSKWGFILSTCYSEYNTMTSFRSQPTQLFTKLLSLQSTIVKSQKRQTYFIDKGPLFNTSTQSLLRNSAFYLTAVRLWLLTHLVELHPIIHTQ